MSAQVSRALMMVGDIALLDQSGCAEARVMAPPVKLKSPGIMEIVLVTDEIREPVGK